MVINEKMGKKTRFFIFHIISNYGIINITDNIEYLLQKNLNYSWLTTGINYDGIMTILNDF